MERPTSAKLPNPDLLYLGAIWLLVSGVVFGSSPAAWIPRAGNLDEWHYIGYGKYYFASPEFNTFSYKLSRLPWILAQTVLRTLFSDNLANILLVYLYILGSAVLVYFLLRRIVGQGSAFLLALLFAILPPNQGAGGWNYHNSAAGPLLLLALLFLSFAVRRKPRTVYMILAGAALAFCIHSNIVFINIIPLAGIWVLILLSLENSSASPIAISCLKSKALPWSLLALVAGSTLATFALAAINKASGRFAEFWMGQLHLASAFIADNSNQSDYWKPLSWEWMIQSPWLLFPLAVFAANLAFCGTVFLFSQIAPGKRILDCSPAKALLSLQAIFFTLLWFAWQIMGQTALDWAYFTFPLIFSSLLGVLPFLSFCKNDKLGEARVGYTLATGALMMLPILAAGYLPDGSEIPYSIKWILALLGTTALLLMSCLCAGHYRLQHISIALVFIVLTFASNRLADYSRQNTVNLVEQDLSEAVFLLTDEIGDEMMAMGQDALLWYDASQRLSVRKHEEKLASSGLAVKMGRPLGSLKSVGLGWMPLPPETQIVGLGAWEEWFEHQLSKSNPIVMVTNDPGNVDQMARQIQKRGFTYSVLKSTIVSSHYFEFPLYILAAPPGLNSD